VTQGQKIVPFVRFRNGGGSVDCAFLIKLKFKPKIVVVL